MLARNKVSLAASTLLAGAGYRAITQEQVAVIAGLSQNITTDAILAGILDRAPAGASTDVLPSVAALLAACPELSVGDAFQFLLRVTTAQTMALTLGAGFTAVGTTSIAASSARMYLISIKSTGTGGLFSGNTVNASATISGFTDAQLRIIQPGNLVSGTGIQAGSTVLSVNLATGAVVLSLTANATGTGVGITFVPTADIKGLWTAGI